MCKRHVLAALFAPLFAQCAASTTTADLVPLEAVAGQATFRAQPASYWIERARKEVPLGEWAGVDALGALVGHDAEVEREVLSLLRDLDPEVREEMAEALRESGARLPESIALELAGLLDDPYDEAAREALMALANAEERYGEPIPALRKALAGEHPSVRSDLGEHLNEIAWNHVELDDPNPRGYAVALPLAQAAVALSAGSDINRLDTLAWALFANGRRDEALATARRVIELDPDGYSMEHYERMQD